jgi:hypothetical protein
MDYYRISALLHRLCPNMDAVLTAQYMRLTRKLYQMILGIRSGLFHVMFHAAMEGAT